MTSDMWLRVRQEKRGKHAEFIQAARTLVESNQVAKEIKYNLGGGQKSTDPSQVINVERGHKNWTRLKLERNPEDLCLLRGEMEFQLRGERDPNDIAKRRTEYSATALEQSFWNLSWPFLHIMVLDLTEKNYMMVLDPPEMTNLLPLVGSKLL